MEHLSLVNCSPSRQSLLRWNELLEWTTGIYIYMPFDLKFRDKNPLLANWGVGLSDYITI